MGCSGGRRTNEDKRKAMPTLLNDEEWGKWSDREIGRRCCVASSMVGDYRKSLQSDYSEPKFTTKHGTVGTMHTENIG